MPTVGLQQVMAQATFWRLWNADGVGWISLLAAAAYLAAIGPLRGRIPGSEPVGRRQAAWFLLGILAMYAAVGSPVDLVADHYLFSAHMLEHVLLLFALPPLVLLGTPAWMARALLRPRWLRAAWAWLTRPVTALVVFNVVLGLWHFPRIYDFTLRNDTVHLCEHATFVIIGLIAWWPILSPLPEMPPLPDPVQILYLFVNEVLMTVLFALITFGPPMYRFYFDVPRLWGLTPLEDQQMGGALMRIGSMASFGVMCARAFGRWAKQEGKIARVDLALRDPASLVAASVPLVRPAPDAAPVREEPAPGR